jgi:uncharacterized small protein (DUF1192 family)
MVEEALSKSHLDAALSAVEREDLDIYAASDLVLRISRLETEVSRTREAIERKKGVRSVADSLFNFTKS